MIKAVIFDADGPLYERSKKVIQLKEKLLSDYGYTGPFDKFKDLYEARKFIAFEGKETIAEMFQWILGQLDVTLSDTQASAFADRFNEIQSHVSATTHAISTLRELKEMGLEVCVLTDSFYKGKEKIPWFNKMGSGQYIDHIVSSFDIKHLKDTPDAYKVCLERLRLNASDVVFVGHQDYEMKGASQSGITSVAIVPISPKGIDSDYKIDSLSELPKLLARIGQTS